MELQKHRALEILEELRRERSLTNFTNKRGSLATPIILIIIGLGLLLLGEENIRNEPLKIELAELSSRSVTKRPLMRSLKVEGKVSLLATTNRGYMYLRMFVHGSHPQR